MNMRLHSHDNTTSQSSRSLRRGRHLRPSGHLARFTDSLTFWPHWAPRSRRSTGGRHRPRRYNGIWASYDADGTILTEPVTFLADDTIRVALYDNAINYLPPEHAESILGTSRTMGYAKDWQSSHQKKMAKARYQINRLRKYVNQHSPP